MCEKLEYASLFGHNSVLTQTDPEQLLNPQTLAEPTKKCFNANRIATRHGIGIHVAAYVTVLPLKELLQAKLQEAIAILPSPTTIFQRRAIAIKTQTRAELIDN